MNKGEIAILCWYVIGALFVANMHGKPKKETHYNFWMWLASASIMFMLMWWAGLFH
ncbi:hypothetical protein LCGC14_2243530 [marine sediment metagenome]|uniref:Uncharacterized protein n=1 Tax=marine sediment metagenome TaxID=412755 RepID=A0A0F9D4W0_9ZZZZ